MARPVIESSNTATGNNVSSLVITKPTSLSVGDLLLVKLAMYDISDANRTFLTPSGWTLQTNSTTGSSSLLVRTATFSKVAESGDVAASNFTFGLSGSVGYVSGYLARISGCATPAISIKESDANNTNTTTPSFTTALTPDTPSASLIIFNIAGSDSNITTETVSGYASTPSLTWTELADIGIEVSTDGLIHGVASAPYDSQVEITNRTATFSVSSGYNASGIVVLRGILDATGTNTLLEVSPTNFSQSGSAGANGTSELLEVSPTFPTQSGSVSSPTQWSNEAKPSTTWTNET